MASQIDQMRAKFNGMNNTQKKDFIDKLKIKLQGSSNTEYKKFLNECVQNYNTAVKGDSVSSGEIKTATSPTYSQLGNAGAKKSKSNCIFCGERAYSSEKRCPNCLMIYKQSLGSGSTSTHKLSPKAKKMIIMLIVSWLAIGLVNTFISSIIGFGIPPILLFIALVVGIVLTINNDRNIKF